MSTFKGTPGPWSWAGNIPNDISAADGTAVCKAYGREYWQANAALIAQAPSMLQVLTALADDEASRDARFELAQTLAFEILDSLRSGGAL